MKKEKLIKHYSYLYNYNEKFIEEYLDNFIESDLILKTIFINIKDMEKDYKINLYDKSIVFINKKTKNSYFITIEF